MMQKMFVEFLENKKMPSKLILIVKLFRFRLFYSIKYSKLNN
jgi:hypothetical protein